MDHIKGVKLSKEVREREKERGGSYRKTEREIGRREREREREREMGRRERDMEGKSKDERV